MQHKHGSKSIYKHRHRVATYLVTESGMWSSSSLPLHLFTFFFLLSIAQSAVPANKTFTIVIQGTSVDFLENTQLQVQDVPNFITHPFALCAYGPLGSFSYQASINPYTPLYTLAIRLGDRVVWEANRGKPFGQNSTLKYGSDGNFVLADPKGRIIWQTNTANKDIAHIQLLKEGNLVLQDTRGINIWESFNHPTDVLLVGQPLLPGDSNKLVSRISVLDNNAGPYSLVLDRGLFLSYKSKTSPKAEIYSLMEKVSLFGVPLEKMALVSGVTDDDPDLYEILFDFATADGGATFITPPGLNALKYDTTYSFLQLRPDGNVRVFTYFDKVREPIISRSPWDEVYSVFSRREFDESECQLPRRCGEFGLCENNQCVACPTTKGLMGWSDTCRSPKLPKCSGSNVVDYYRLNGVEHFSSKFSGNEPVKLADCREQCSRDCKCLGFFYKEETSNCLVTYQLNTLSKVANSTHVAFIKMAK